MANYRHGATYGSLAYDLDALAREKQLDEAGKLPQKKVRPAQPEVQPVQRRQSAARAAVRPSPVLLLGTVLVVGPAISVCRRAPVGARHPVLSHFRPHLR